MDRKRLIAPTAADALARVRSLVRDISKLEAEKTELIGVAQAHGASWDEIGDALHVSRQAAWAKYRDSVRSILSRTATAGGSEAELLESAAAALAEVRRHRR